MPGVLSKIKIAKDFIDPDVATIEINNQLKRCEEIGLSYEKNGHRGIVILEGWDCAGKSGIVSRLQQSLSPDVCRAWHFKKPMEMEQSIHYMYRFWQKLPSPGMIAIFDRSWYGRVVAEPIEGLATPNDQKRAYGEIDFFEKMLINDGVRIAKIFLHYEKSEFGNRIKEKINKKLAHTLSENDFRTYEQYDKYYKAFDKMLIKTKSGAAWNVVDATDRNKARIDALKYILDVLSDGVNMECPAISADTIHKLTVHFPDETIKNQVVLEDAKLHLRTNNIKNDVKLSLEKLLQNAQKLRRNSP
jgi:polyphosphate kinase 2 (PPK2 family)